jgi:hypothetical protein
MQYLCFIIFGSSHTKKFKTGGGFIFSTNEVLGQNIQQLKLSNRAKNSALEDRLGCEQNIKMYRI